MTDLLRPCPFCGSDNIRPALQNFPYVECMDCHAFGPNVETEVEDWETQKKRIHLAWNRHRSEL